MDLLPPILAISLVLCLLWVVVYFLKRRQGMPMPLSRLKKGDTGLEILGRIALTPQHSVFRIGAGKRCLLLGVHPGGFTLLEDIPRGLESE